MNLPAQSVSTFDLTIGSHVESVVAQMAGVVANSPFPYIFLGCVVATFGLGVLLWLRK